MGQRVSVAVDIFQRTLNDKENLGLFFQHQCLN